MAAKRSGEATPEGSGYLRTAEVADILHVSRKTVSRWAKQGKLPFLTTLGGHRRYPEAKIRHQGMTATTSLAGGSWKSRVTASPTCLAGLWRAMRPGVPPMGCRPALTTRGAARLRFVGEQ